MVYDCFTFYNEKMMLDIRLNCLKDVVDKFVLVESTHTFSGLRKKLFYEEFKNLPEFTPFRDRIIYVIFDEPPSPDRWENEKAQRNAIARGLTGLKPDDAVLISDIDEIPNPGIFEGLRSHRNPCRLVQKTYYYYFNCQLKEMCYRSFFCRYRDFTGADRMRQDPNFDQGVTDAGWHYSYIMSPEEIAEKISVFSHSEYDNEHFKNQDRIRHCIENKLDLFTSEKLTPVELDGPEYVMNNIERFKDYIL
jgi:beta-1,4-mannosyl-glycoprotein beta-1,4-N-acetylglucosaminyltransferase